MNKKPPVREDAFRVTPIGYIRGPKTGRRLEILEPYRPAMRRLGSFSHVIVLWWAHSRDNPKYRSLLQTRPPYAKKHLTGIFATRAPYRPNPIAVTTCRILSVDEGKGTIRISGIDAKEGTPIVDLKAYFPCCDRVKEAHIAPWIRGWTEWMHEY